MKKASFSVALLLAGSLISSFSIHQPIRSAEPITETERKYAVNYFIEAKLRLLNDVKGLSEAQLNYKADSSRWSIAQCVEHIAISESMLWQWLQGTMAQAPTPDKRSQVKMTTPEIVTAMTDRTHKFKAPEMLQPSGKFPDEQTALNSYMNRRDSTIQYLRGTQDDLKDHFITHPVFGTVDCYQGFVMLAAHSVRHTMQIEEVKASPGFPKQ